MGSMVVFVSCAAVRNERGEIVEWYGIAADIEDSQARPRG